MSGPQAHWLPGRRRLHLGHGPIDLILEAWGDPAAPREVRWQFHLRCGRID